jgi:hypothetical protein
MAADDSEEARMLRELLTNLSATTQNIARQLSYTTQNIAGQYFSSRASTYGGAHAALIRIFVASHGNFESAGWISECLFCSAECVC